MHSDDLAYLAYLASTSLRPGSARYIDPASGGFTSHPAGKSGSEVETGPRLPRSHLAEPSGSDPPIYPAPALIVAGGWSGVAAVAVTPNLKSEVARSDRKTAGNAVHVNRNKQRTSNEQSNEWRSEMGTMSDRKSATILKWALVQKDLENGISAVKVLERLHGGFYDHRERAMDGVTFLKHHWEDE